MKTEDVYEDFSNDREMFAFSNCSSQSKYYDNSSKLVIGKMKDENGDVAIEEFVRLKPKIFSFLETIMNRKKQKARIKILLQQ